MKHNSLSKWKRTNLSKRIRLARLLNDRSKLEKKIGISQDELSKISGISQSLISKVEAGDAFIPIEVYEKILDALDLTWKDPTRNFRVRPNSFFNAQDSVHVFIDDEGFAVASTDFYDRQFPKGEARPYYVKRRNGKGWFLLNMFKKKEEKTGRLF